MEIVILREPRDSDVTFGKMYIDDVYECETLEDRVREKPGIPVSEWKIPKVTAIPYGRYKIKLYNSPKYGRLVPMLLNVDGYSYVLIHWGNFHRDTDGCILVGDSRFKEFSINNSRATFNKLFPKIEKAIKEGQEVWLTIKSVEDQ